MAQRKTVTENQPSDIESRIIPVTEVPVFLKVLVYGRSGSGKTTFIGTCPKPLLVLDVREQGTTSIRSREDTFVLKIEDWDELEEVYWYLAGPGKDRFKTVAIDTVTPLQDLALKKVTGDEGGVISRRSWGEAASMMKTWIMAFRDLPLHVIFTAQDRETSNDEIEDDSILPEVGPYVMPSVAKILNASVGIIGQVYIRETTEIVDNTPQSRVNYCMRIGPHSRYLTKLRRDPTLSGAKMPGSVINPTFNKLMKLSLEEMEVKTDG